ncbi:MAG TPA: (d)CMP kinase [Planctomycetes bacterium]|nr:(d)CMP kinase [Planctomycetota bacterium]
MIIAIDGPAGAGKSTVARAVARALGLAFLDTGAMYRAVTLEVLDRGLDPMDGAACGEVARGLDLSFDEAGKVLLGGVSREAELRGETVTRTVSTVSSHGAVREAIVAKQREIAAKLGGVVAEGRDTTTVVFPEASHKFYLSASARERARRRAFELDVPGRIDEIQADIERRDRLDSTRAHSPLRIADDAVEIDTDALAVEEVVARILARIRSGRGGEGKP